jgi:hypothetical protein
MPLRLFTKTLVFFALIVTATMGQTVSVQVETKNVGLESASYLVISCNSNVPLSGLRIPLRIGASSDVIIDSVSFQYTIATGNFRRQSQLTDFNREGFINIIPNIASPIPTFPAGWGEIFRIHFRTTKSAPDINVPVDTFYRLTQVGGINVYLQLEASDAFGTTLYPSFAAGGINIRQATAVENANTGLPDQFSLGQNFPNPFNPATQIVFSLTRPESIRLDVYNVAGQRLTTLAEGKFPPGEHVVIWEAGAQPSGIYFYRLTTDSGVMTRKMLLIK